MKPLKKLVVLSAALATQFPTCGLAESSTNLYTEPLLATDLTCKGVEHNSVNGYPANPKPVAKFVDRRLFRPPECRTSESSIECIKEGQEDIKRHIDGAIHWELTINRYTGSISEKTLTFHNNNFLVLKFEGTCEVATKKF